MDDSVAVRLVGGRRDGDVIVVPYDWVARGEIQLPRPAGPAMNFARPPSEVVMTVDTYRVVESVRRGVPDRVHAEIVGGRRG
jgi:hypothetical protein